MNPFELFEAVFGLPYWRALLLVAGWGVMLGAYWWTFDIDPVASVRRLLRR